MQLDKVKAYDKLSWSYIREILKAYGFEHNYIKWVMDLVTTNSCSILLNGFPSRTLRPSRGLRQGDPLSPFLFILMMEGLGKVINLAKEEGRIEGRKLTHNGDTLTHQQFVDDTMLQGIPTVKEAKAFKQICMTSQWLFALRFQRDNLPSKYLGSPLTDKPLSKEVWESVTNKLKDEVNN
eukprot:PITA_14375